MKHYFLGLSASYKHPFRYIFANGSDKDAENLRNYLSQEYGGETILMKNGRSALCQALKAYFKPGDSVIVNGFTCYAVIEAIKAAKLTPVYADIDAETLNFDINTLNALWNEVGVNPPKGIIVQNSLGNPVDMVSIERFANEHNLVIIEDLAHCAGIKYPDGREAGMVGSAVAFSFGKEKSIDAINGGAVVFRELSFKLKGAPVVPPKEKARTADNLRARFYPWFGMICRGLSYVKLGGVMMKILVALRFVEKSADNKLELDRKISNFEAKEALKQLKELRSKNVGVLRRFYLLENRDEVLQRLKKAGYYFDGFWYERPVSPARYYANVNFPEDKCKMAVAVSQHIINFPIYYTAHELAQAERIVREFGKKWEIK